MSKRRWWFAVMAAVLFFGAGFGAAKAYIGWTRLSTPCDSIAHLAGTAEQPMIVCDDQPGVIYIKQ